MPSTPPSTRTPNPLGSNVAWWLSRPVVIAEVGAQVFVAGS